MPPHESDRIRTLDNGAKVIPAVEQWAPKKTMGAFAMNKPCEELGGRQMTLTPGYENLWCEWRCKKDLFNEAKRYEVTMRYKTNSDQDISCFVYMAKDPPHYERSIALPSTGEEWSTFKFILETDLGGFKDSTMRWEINQVQGDFFFIKDFTFAPPGSDETGQYSGPWFADWLDQVTEQVKDVFPTLQDDDRQALTEAATKLHQATGDTYNPFCVVESALELARAGKDDPTKEALKEARDEFENLALPLLEGMDPALDGLNLDSPEVLQYLVLIHAQPNNLGTYCHDASEEQIQRLMEALKGSDTDLLKQMILGGGAKGGHYGKALDIYYEIQDKMQTDKSILPKLQLACALELCQPLAIFDTVQAVDAVERYFGYEKAYLDGMLDPAFESFSVWELRMVVDSDASNDELDWGRHMLLTYRPDMCEMNDQCWRYSSIVKSDVKYTRPDWKPDVPRDMIQALSRGGKCGPRAFFGRFINKAFGNPTWGLRQPGHAALSKWTPTGWASCLGGQVGDKDGRDYRDFQFEVYIRKKMGDDFHCRKVDMLIWMQLVESVQDNKMDINRNFPSTHWLNLAAIQRKRFGDTDKPYPAPEYGRTKQCEVLTKITQIQQREEPPKEEITVGDDGTIVIPSSSLHDSKNIAIAKSLDSGKQFNAAEMWWAEYRIPADILPAERAQYNLTMRIACVHDKDVTNPFQWIITSPHHNEKPMMEYSVPVQYTKGLWEETGSVEVTLGGGGEEKLRLMRQKPCLPISVKDFKLTPV